jgi:hypothetical protein
MVDNETEQALAAEAPTTSPGPNRDRREAGVQQGRELKCCPPRGVWEIGRLDRGFGATE